MPNTDSTLASHIIFATDDAGMIVSASTSGVFLTTASKFAVGCRLTDSTNGKQYINTGTVAAPVWTLLASSGTSDPAFLQYAAVTINAADLVATGAGKFGHANGVLLIPAAPTGYVNTLVKATMSYTFGVAAYTAGGNITVNIGGGGAALTGLVSAANSVGAASSKIVDFLPLSTAGVALTTAQSLNLVSSAAFTQPGTATGTIKVHLWYQQVPLV